MSVMRTVNPIQRYRLGRAALQVGEFTIAELQTLARVPRGTVYHFLAILRNEIPGSLEQKEIREHKVGRPILRYMLTETGEKSLATTVANLGRQLAGHALVYDLARTVPAKVEVPEPILPEVNVSGWLGSLDPSCREALEQRASLLFRPTEPVIAEYGGLRKTIAAGFSYTKEQIQKVVRTLLTAWQWKRLEERGWTAGAYAFEGLPALNIVVQKMGSAYTVEIKPLSERIPTLEDLHLPGVVRKFCDIHKGMVLVSGEPGSGKSHTVASIVNCLNQTRDDRIATIDEPAHYFYPKAKALLDQKQVAID